MNPCRILESLLFGLGRQPKVFRIAESFFDCVHDRLIIRSGCREGAQRGTRYPRNNVINSSGTSTFAGSLGRLCVVWEAEQARPRSSCCCAFHLGVKSASKRGSRQRKSSRVTLEPVGTRKSSMTTVWYWSSNHNFRPRICLVGPEKNPEPRAPLSLVRRRMAGHKPQPGFRGGNPCAEANKFLVLRDPSESQKEKIVMTCLAADPGHVGSDTSQGTFGKGRCRLQV